MANIPFDTDAEILVVDDEPAIHRMMQRVLGRAGYRVASADDGEQALKKIVRRPPDLIILDLNMPNSNGFEVAEQLKSREDTCNIPVILMTGNDTVDNLVKALDMGVNDFLSKTAYPDEIRARIRSHLKIKRLNDEVQAYHDHLEKMVALRTAQLKNASLEVIWRLTAASEFRDVETGAHIQRMSHYSAAIARRMGLNDKTAEAILYGAAMHDIGKIGIPDRILLKPGKLDAREWDIMMMHAVIGADILKGSDIGVVRLGEMIARTHHEKWDGSGYPDGLAGCRIPLAARIVALADVFDALTSKRPYKDPLSVEKSNRIILEERGRHFDPAVVDSFFSIQDEIRNIKARYQDEGASPIYTLDQLLNGTGQRAATSMGM